jgi:hypothetical protein
VVHDSMKPWTTNKNYREWKQDVKHHQTKKVKRSSKDMCRKGSFCKGAKNIPRKLMPQIYDVNAFSKKIKRKYNVRTRRLTMKAKVLKPSQNEINEERVDDVIEEIGPKKKIKHPVVVSKDKYVVDGHHRWAAMKKAAPEKRIPVVMINAPISDALGVAVAAGTKREKF